MIRITIERNVSEHYVVTENQVETEEPTEIAGETESSYGNTRKVVTYKRTYRPVQVTKINSFRQTLLTQEIADETQFDLAATIIAINKIKLP